MKLQSEWLNAGVFHLRIVVFECVEGLWQSAEVQDYLSIICISSRGE